MTSSENKKEDLKELSSKLIELSEKCRLYKKTLSQVQFLGKRLEEEKEREKKLYKKLRKEKKDVKMMERLSLKHLFHVILQNANSQKEKEKQEYLAAELQWEQCCDEIRFLEKDEKAGYALLDSLKYVQGQYDGLFSRKEEIISSGADRLSKMLVMTSERLSKKEGERNEIKEAMKVGEQLLEQLGIAGSYLKSASGWGTLDILGGGLLATAIKRGKMDNAKDAMQNAQHMLNQFNKELKDIRSDNLELEFGGFSAFADYFFDCLIIDWMVQSSINKAYAGVSDLYDKVKEINSRLSSREKEITTELGSMQQEYRSIVESAEL